jgi:malate/lactate dehydrogenase
VVDRGGVEQVIHLELDKNEVEKLRHSAELLKTTTKSLGLN